jgi:hypothetical protein
MKKRALQPLARMRPLLSLACAAALSGCTYWVSKQELALAAAGFQQVPADTPERQALLKRLPAHEFVRDANGDPVIYVYADPVVCHCLFVCSEGAYKYYRHLGVVINGDKMGGLEGNGPFNQHFNPGTLH